MIILREQINKTSRNILPEQINKHKKENTDRTRSTRHENTYFRRRIKLIKIPSNNLNLTNK
jgi:hypothetical protein